MQELSYLNVVQSADRLSCPQLWHLLTGVMVIVAGSIYGDILLSTVTKYNS